jgi:hypothetical protein
MRYPHGFNPLLGVKVVKFVMVNKSAVTIAVEAKLHFKYIRFDILFIHFYN